MHFFKDYSKSDLYDCKYKNQDLPLMNKCLNIFMQTLIRQNII